MPPEPEPRIERMTLRVPAALAGDGRALGGELARRLAEQPPPVPPSSLRSVDVRVRAHTTHGLADAIADAVRSALR